MKNEPEETGVEVGPAAAAVPVRDKGRSSRGGRRAMSGRTVAGRRRLFICLRRAGRCSNSITRRFSSADLEAPPSV